MSEISIPKEFHDEILRRLQNCDLIELKKKANGEILFVEVRRNVKKTIVPKD